MVCRYLTIFVILLLINGNREVEKKRNFNNNLQADDHTLCYTYIHIKDYHDFLIMSINIRSSPRTKVANKIFQSTL